MALGHLVEGKWTSEREQEGSQERFLRPATTFRDLHFSFAKAIALPPTVLVALKLSLDAIIFTSVWLALGHIVPQLCGS